jgi:predicted nucleotidyltransferase
MDNEALLGEVSRRLGAAVAGVKVVAFGSRARGDAHETSDLDLMVVMDHQGSLGDRSWEIRRHLLDLPVAIDLVVYTPAEYERFRTWTTAVAAIADREGRTLVG